MGMVEAERFYDVYEARLAASFLQAADIDAQVADNSLASVDPLLQRALGGIRLMVPADQLAEAKGLLARVAAGEFSEPGDDDIEIAGGSAALSAAAMVGFIVNPALGLAFVALRRRPTAMQALGVIIVIAIVLATLAALWPSA